MKNNIISFLLLLGITTQLYSAKLNFKDGTSLDGHIKSITEDKVILEFEFGDVERLRSEILSVTNLMPSEETILQNAPRAQDLMGITQETSQETPPAIIPTLPALSTVGDTLEESEDGEENGSTRELETSAYNSILMLKTKIAENFERQKNDLLKNFENERQLLEKNLREMTEKYNELERTKSEESTQSTTIKAEMEKQKELIAQYQEEIAKLKKNLSEMEEQKLKTEVEHTQALTLALSKNKELLDNEKSTLKESYEGQINALKTQLDQGNSRILELAAQNTQLSQKVADLEKKLEEYNTLLASKNREFELYRQENEKKLGETTQKTASSQSNIEKALESSAKTISHLRDFNSRLKDENKLLKDSEAQIKTELSSAKEEIEALEKERIKYKEDMAALLNKQSFFKKKTKKDHEKLLKSLVDNAMLESKKDAPPPSNSLEVSLPEAGDEAVKKEAVRAEILSLFQEDMKKANKNLEETQNALKETQKEKVTLEGDLSSLKEQMKLILQEKKKQEERAEKAEREKDAIRSEFANFSKELREESSANLEKQKAEFQKQLEKALKDLEGRNRSAASASSGEGDLDYLSTLPEPSPKKTKEKTKKSQEKVEVSEESEIPVPSDTTTPKMEVGSISQIEADFNRVFIDTHEKLKKGDTVYVATKSGEAPFKILIVYDDETMKGAIAEIKTPELLKGIKVRDVAYVK